VYSIVSYIYIRIPTYICLLLSKSADNRSEKTIDLRTLVLSRYFVHLNPLTIFQRVQEELRKLDEESKYYFHQTSELENNQAYQKGTCIHQSSLVKNSSNFLCCFPKAIHKNFSLRTHFWDSFHKDLIVTIL